MLRIRLPLFFDSLLRDRHGATAVEFAMIAAPFFMLTFAIAGIGTHFFISGTLEKGVEAAARKIRTGEAQKSETTMEGFKASVCAEANFNDADSPPENGWIDCNKLVVHIQHGDHPADITPTPCLTNGTLTPPAGSGTEVITDFSGEKDVFVLVTLCYERENAILPYFSLSNMSNGSEVMQAATTFRTEPYE
jgi:Flp pilus assembly protein TadG